MAVAQTGERGAVAAVEEVEKEEKERDRQEIEEGHCMGSAGEGIPTQRYIISGRG